MADSKTFVLVGNFQDNISPALDKINSSLNSLKRNLGGFSAKKGGFDDLTKSMGKVISAHKILNEEVKSLQSSLRSSISTLKEYRSEMGKAARANYATSRSGSSAAQKEAKFWQEAANSAKTYKRELSGIRTPRMPSQPQPRRPFPPPPPVDYSGDSTGGRSPRGSRAGYGAAVAGGVLGNQLSEYMTSAIVQGFRIGVSLMQQPFQYFAGAFKERIRDELDDLKAAGGFLSIAKRQKDPFVKTMDEAIDYQQATNATMAKLAGALPGTTNDYVQVSKRLSDTITRIVGQDVTGAIQESNRIRSTAEGAQFYGGQIKDAGKLGQQQAITTLLGEMTKKTVLAGMGGRSGAGGMMGPYGLPGLSERMLSQAQVSMGQFQRYAAVFSDPTVSDALSRHVDKINATQANTLQRLEAYNAMMDEIVTPELVEKLRTSFDGVYQSMRSAILDPDTGIFGLGRQFAGFGKRINSLGQYLDASGKVVTDINNAAEANLSIYEMLRDIFTQIGQVLTPFLTYLPMVWDPLKNIASVLKDSREYTTIFVRSFNQYREGIKQFAQGLPDASKFKLMESLDIRASLSAINNLFAEFKVISEEEFAKVGKQLLNPDLNIGALMSQMLDKFFRSDIAKKVGEFIGTLIGTILRQVADATKFVSGMVEGGGFAGGLAAGFKKAGGFSAVQDIFVSIIKLFFKAILAAITEMPMVAAGVTALALLPTVIGAAVTNMVEKALTSTFLLDKVRQFIATRSFNAAKIQAPLQTPKPLVVEGAPKSASFRATPKGRIVNPDFPQTALGEYKGIGGVTSPGKAPSMPKNVAASAKDPALLRGIKSFSLSVAQASTSLKGVGSWLTNFVKGVGPRFTGFFTGILGKLSIFGAVITSVISLFQGEDLATALAKGAGPLLGAALGAALLPFLGPIGPMIGAYLGSQLGSTASVVEPLKTAFADLGSSVSSVGKFLWQIGTDLTGLARLIPGVNSEFDLLRWTLSLVLSPLTLLKLAVLGVYEAYLNIKEKLFNLSPEERAARDEVAKQRRVGTAAYQNSLDVRSLRDQISGVKADIKKVLTHPLGDRASAKQQQEWRSFVEKGQTPMSERYFGLMNRLTLLYEKEKTSRQGTRPEAPPKPTTLAAPRPAAIPAAPRPATIPAAPTVPTVVGKPGFLTLGGRTFWRGTDGGLNPVVGGLTPSPAPSSVVKPAPGVPKPAVTAPAPASTAAAAAAQTANNLLTGVKTGVNTSNAKLTAIQTAIASNPSSKSTENSSKTIASNTRQISSRAGTIVTRLTTLNTSTTAIQKNTQTTNSTLNGIRSTLNSINGKMSNQQALLSAVQGIRSTLTSGAVRVTVTNPPKMVPPATGGTSTGGGGEAQSAPPQKATPAFPFFGTLFPWLSSLQSSPKKEVKDDKAGERIAQLGTAAEKGATSLGSATASLSASASKSSAVLSTSAKSQEGIFSRIASSWQSTNTSSSTKLQGSATGLANAINNAANKLKSASAGMGSVGALATTSSEPKSAAGAWKGNTQKKMPLAQAIAQEERHMPSGSHLVIANSSETIIPAHQGLNLDGLAGGLDKFQGALNGLANMASQFGGLGGAQGNLSGTLAIAKRFGLVMTSYLRTWPTGSYHTMGRAMDFGGDPGRMLAFARFMASNYGSSITELIHTPLGFGIKNRQKVAPYSAANHYDHVHVAYGLGAGNPAFFTSAAAADRWELAMSRKEPIISSVRATASEVGGGTYNVTNNFSITQQPGQDPDTLASLVVMKLSMAIDDLRNHTA